MLCQNCSKREATTHIKRVVNGETAQMYLCSSCAAQLGYNDVFSDFGMNFGDFFASVLGEGIKGKASAIKRCEQCGSSYTDISKSGKLGCANCYQTFYEELLPTIQRIHGKTAHNGKNVNDTVIETEADSADEVEKLRNEMKTAVEGENFEKAAELRDKIKRLEEGKK